MKISGIYSITNKINGKVYYGSSFNINGRWRCHKSKLNNNIHPNIHLQNSYNKYGVDVFEFRIEKEVPVEQLLDTEQKYLDKVKEEPKMYYNISKNSVCWNRGIHLPQSMKNKISKANKGINTGENNGMYNKPAPNRDLTLYTFINNITNEKFVGLKSEFYKKYNLRETRIKDLIKGIRKSHKNWLIEGTIKLKGGHDKTIYTFKNNITNEVFIGKRFELAKKYNLDLNLLCAVVKGRRKHHKNWQLEKAI